MFTTYLSKTRMQTPTSARFGIKKMQGRHVKKLKKSRLYERYNLTGNGPRTNDRI